MGRRPMWRAVRKALLLVMVSMSTPMFLVAQHSNADYKRMVLSIQELIEHGDLESARSQLVNAEKLYPLDGGLENLLGVIEVQQGHTDAAEREFSRAILHSPKLTSAYLNLGRVYLQVRNQDKSAPAKALEVYENALIIAPTNPEANYQAAVLLMHSKSYASSLKHLARLDAARRASTAAMAVECGDEAGLGHKQEAERAATTLIASADLAEADAMEIAPLLRAEKRPDLAVLILAATQEKNPLSPSALRELGLSLEADGKLGEARSTLERAFAADATSTPLLMDLARVACATKDYRGALGYLAHARDIEPNNASLPYYFGLVSLELGLLGESRKALGEAVRLAPENPGYNFAMGTVSSFAQDATVAIPYLEKYHALRPSDPAGILALGTTYFRAKDFDTATTWLKQALPYPKTAANAHYYLGRIARQMGRQEEAAAELNQSVALKPDQPDVLAELGLLYVQMRKFPESEKYLDRAIELNADSYAANFGLLQLYAHTSDKRREAQSKRFEEIKSKNQAQFQEMMRIIEIRPQESSMHEQN